MNIIIAGGSGFIGSRLAEKFLREGHHVTVIDIVRPSTKLRPKSRAMFCNISLMDSELEEVFKDKPVDIVFNCTLAQKDDEESHLSMINGNIKLVSMTIKYNVKKYIYLSNTGIDLLENNLAHLTLQEKIAFKYFLLNKKISEEYCFEAFENTQVQIMIIRLPMIFGNGMKKNFESYYFTKTLQNILSNTQNEKTILLNEFEALYVNDCIKEITDLTKEEKFTHKYYSLEGTIITAKELIDFISSIYPLNNIEIDIIDKKDIDDSNKKIVNVLKNRSIPDEIENGLKLTFEWFIEKKNKKENHEEKKNEESVKTDKKIIYPISENLLGLLFAYLGYIISNGYFDTIFPYIMIMGMRYGLKNAFTAACLGIAMKLFILKYAQTLGVVEWLFMIVSYLLTVFISSFVTDKQKCNIENANCKIKLLEDKLDTMARRQKQHRKTISTLSEQIKVSDKSFGKVHQATRKLDSFNSKKLFDEMKNVVCEITNFEKVYLYTVNRSEWALDLYSTVKADIIAAKTRINIYEHEVFGEIMFKRKFFINKQMEESLPDAIIPIVDKENGRVEAVIIIKEIPFDNLNTFTEYILQMTGELLSDSLTSANKFERLQNPSPGFFDNWMEEVDG